MKEKWKDIPDYEGLYQISNYGFVKSFPRNGTTNEVVYLSAWFDGKGYQKVTLSKNGKRKQYPLHRLVASAYVPNPHNYRDVRFIDGDKYNVICTNLEWCNISHIPKRHKKGAFSTYAKFTDAQIQEIRNQFIRGHKLYGCKGLAEKYGVAKSTISYIVNGKTYK